MRNQKSFSLEFKRQVVDRDHKRRKPPRAALPEIQHHILLALPLEEAIQPGQIQ